MGSGVGHRPRAGQSEPRDLILGLVLKPSGEWGLCLLDFSMGGWGPELLQPLGLDERRAFGIIKLIPEDSGV